MLHQRVNATFEGWRNNAHNIINRNMQCFDNIVLQLGINWALFMTVYCTIQYSAPIKLPLYRTNQLLNLKSRQSVAWNLNTKLPYGSSRIVACLRTLALNSLFQYLQTFSCKLQTFLPKILSKTRLWCGSKCSSSSSSLYGKQPTGAFWCDSPWWKDNKGGEFEFLYWWFDSALDLDATTAATMHSSSEPTNAPAIADRRAFLVTIIDNNTDGNMYW